MNALKLQPRVCTFIIYALWLYMNICIWTFWGSAKITKSFSVQIYIELTVCYVWSMFKFRITVIFPKETMFLLFSKIKRSEWPSQWLKQGRPTSVPVLKYFVDKKKVLSNPTGRHTAVGVRRSDRKCIIKHCICALLFQCKHILAIYLCRAMGVTQQESVSDQQMTMILSGANISWHPGASGHGCTSPLLARERGRNTASAWRFNSSFIAFYVFFSSCLLSKQHLFMGFCLDFDLLGQKQHL